MQNEEGFPQGFVLGTPQQSGMPNFVTTPTDIFGYPLSAPATAPVFTDTRPFWENDTSLTGMEYDFHAASTAMFQAQGHRTMNSLDWGRTNDMFQETGIIPHQQALQNQENNISARRERPLAPKPTPSAPSLLEPNSQDTSMFGTSFIAPMDSTFAMMNQSGVVDPGLLFSRPISSNIEPVSFVSMAQPAVPVHAIPQQELVPIAPKPPASLGLRRVSSNKESNRKPERAMASSPVKSNIRPGLSRSFSENKGRKAAHRASLPALAPAARPIPQQTSGGRPTTQGSRSSGRSSPLKNHHRLSSLSSIPETLTPKIKTSVKFTIDSHGRARAETTTVTLSEEEDESTPRAIRSRKEVRPVSRHWNSSGEDESSDDDDPIIIPSRNASFAMPDPNKPPSRNQSFALPDPNRPTSANPLYSSRRSLSEQSTGSLGIYFSEPKGSSVEEVDSEAETEVQQPQGSRGDATSELRKVVQDRQKRASWGTTPQAYASGPRSSASTISPSSLIEGNLPTPSSLGSSIRCVCRRSESPRNSDGFMIQW